MSCRIAIPREAIELIPLDGRPRGHARLLRHPLTHAFTRRHLLFLEVVAIPGSCSSRRLPEVHPLKGQE